VSAIPGEGGPLTQVVLSYERVMRELVPTVKAPADWAPLAEFVAVDDFERVGTFLEVQDWGEYTVMLTRWATSIDSFETSVRRISELSDLVYYEIEERHRRGNVVGVVNSLTVFAFDRGARISHLDVYLQQPRP
jgi:hypothetical protein